MLASGAMLLALALTAAATAAVWAAPTRQPGPPPPLLAPTASGVRPVRAAELAMPGVAVCQVRIGTKDVQGVVVQTATCGGKNPPECRQQLSSVLVKGAEHTFESACVPLKEMAIIKLADTERGTIFTRNDVEFQG